MTNDPKITHLFELVEAGDPGAANQLFDLVYNELHKLAGRLMDKEQSGHTLQSTALVHEVWLKLFGGKVSPELKDRRHFFAVAAMAMRRVLIDSARARNRVKRGKSFERATWFEDKLAWRQDEELLALDDALKQLTEHDEMKAKLVELRFFGGLTFEQAADCLEIAPSTAKRYWKISKAWLAGKLDFEESA